MGEGWAKESHTGCRQCAEQAILTLITLIYIRIIAAYIYSELTRCALAAAGVGWMDGLCQAG